MLGKSWVIVNLKDGISWVYLKWLSQKVVGAGASQSHAITDFSETAISTTASNVVQAIVLTANVNGIMAWVASSMSNKSLKSKKSKRLAIR